MFAALDKLIGGSRPITQKVRNAANEIRQLDLKKIKKNVTTDMLKKYNNARPLTFAPYIISRSSRRATSAEVKKFKKWYKERYEKNWMHDFVPQGRLGMFRSRKLPGAMRADLNTNSLKRLLPPGVRTAHYNKSKGVLQVWFNNKPDINDLRDSYGDYAKGYYEGDGAGNTWQGGNGYFIRGKSIGISLIG